ncbi:MULTISPECIES: DUF397 domain-containing protein [Streptomyces]|uniref:DUF397 domain-containing protein n=1 Tax=Streptomyces koelreuteriae TaxID=2838015 RepID=A0ABX8FWS9_9ACTN|nr:MULTISPECIES: DUF397 domain-containing protein [Streptomyces]QWB25559.1 DUF397 domain-containing protein [Streptomyces koelreuteriae]UUA08606.1 DUF397 domain-containing protein [Streptomyces koelreuteriae]UUA16211.1 DUF397 domain-containing protein [Streptomyces sp. CRCS-T-1]
MPTHPAAHELASAQSWFKSSYSDGTGQNCLEATHLSPSIAIRDSKTPTGPALLLPPAAWTAFLTHVGREEKP